MQTNTTIDFVKIAEENPVNTLSSDFNNKLVSKIKQNFTQEQQQLFIASFYCYLNCHPTNDYVVDLDNVWKWLGFSTKQRIIELLEKHFVIENDYKVLLTVESKQKKQDNRGGHNKKTILLNIDTFKELCVISNTSKAKEIRKYFVKMEQLLHETIKEECNEIKEKLSNTQIQNEKKMREIEEKSVKELENKLKNEKLLLKHNLMLRDFGKQMSIVYIIRVKTLDNGCYIIKIGESRNGIKQRFDEHKSHYEEAIVLDCFPVRNSKQFEMFLHSKLKTARYNHLDGHTNEKELFIIGNEFSYSMIEKIVKDNIHKFNDYTQAEIERLQTENEILKNELQYYKTLLTPEILQRLLQFPQQTTTTENPISPVINRPSPQVTQINELEKKINVLIETVEQHLPITTTATPQVQQPIKLTTNFGNPLPTLGPRVQQINPDNFTIHKVYESVADCIKQHNFTLKRPSIDKAVKENTIYAKYRWMYVPRDVDPNVLYQEIPPTITTRPQQTGYIAKLNAEKTEIVNLYLDRKTASIMNGFSASGLDNVVKNNTLCNGFYYELYVDCDDQLKENFVNLKNGGKEPILYKDQTGIGQFNADNDLVKEYKCKYDCIKQLQFSDKTMAKCLEQNMPYKNHFFRFLPEKKYI